jgi:hypothetical protein
MLFRSPRFAALLVVSTLAAAACDEVDDNVFIGPKGVAGPSHVVSTFVIPSTLPFHVMPVVGCPFASPFASNFSVIVDPLGVDLILTEVGLQFFDADGFVSPLTFSQSDLTLLFGSTIVTSGIRRTFAFDSRFGCGLRSSPRAMTGRFVFADRDGDRFERTVHARFGGR